MKFRKMRRHKQELSKEECVDILTNEPRGVLALLGDYDYPYALPMSHVYVNGKIYFHGAMEGHKNDQIRPKRLINSHIWETSFSQAMMIQSMKFQDFWTEQKYLK